MPPKYGVTISLSPKNQEEPALPPASEQGGTPMTDANLENCKGAPRKTYYGYRFYSIPAELKKLREKGMAEEQIAEMETLIRAQVDSDDRFYDNNYVSPFEGEALSIQVCHLRKKSERRKIHDTDWRGTEYRTIRPGKSMELEFLEEDCPLRDDLWGDIRERDLFQILGGLSERKQAILSLMVQGFSGKDIAESLGITPPAVTKAKKAIAEAFRGYAVKMHYLR